MNKNKLICFDMDGVLISSMVIANQIFYDLVEDFFGFDTSPYRDQKNLMAVSVEDRLHSLWGHEMEKQGVTDSQIRDFLEEFYQRKTSADTPILPYAKEAVKKVAESFQNLAAVSSNRESAIEETLDKIGLSSYFKKITGLDRVRFSKPDPEIYEQTIEYFGVNPKNSLTIEDSTHGIQSAKGAGMKVIAVTTGLEGREELEKENPDGILNDLSELNVDLIERVFE
jgi:HAD superfamily hydrolase (TIGR01509 family)